jgi:hypothetical protein
MVDETETVADGPEAPEEILEEFRAFIEDVKPEDFGG